MDKSEDRQELLKRVTAATLRAVSGLPQLTVSFAHEVPNLSGDAARLPMPPHHLAPLEVTRLRGSADAMALRLRHHDKKVHQSHLPGGREAREIYNTVEQVRVEALGCERRTRSKPKSSDRRSPPGGQEASVYRSVPATAGALAESRDGASSTGVDRHARNLCSSMMRKKCPKLDSAIAQPNPTMRKKMKHQYTRLKTATVSSSTTS